MLEQLPSELPVKVMSFNIAHGRGMNGRTDLEATAQTIEEAGAELIGLQEVDRFFSDRSFFEDQVAWLSERLGMYAAYGANLDLDPEEAERPRQQYGNAVLSKYPIRFSRNHLLTQVMEDFGNDEQRGVLETVIDLDGTYISFFCTHLALKDAELAVSIDELVAIAGKTNFPRIIIGDFNAPPSHVQMKKLTRHFADVYSQLNKSDAYTYPAPFMNAITGEQSVPVTRIDYIFIDPAFEAAGGSVIETAVSDHLPIVAQLTVKGARSRKAQVQVQGI